jgi:N-acetylglucosaminyldiphosphoundecaprenol N-acetyl-beta-D-mannosaminyltransferase
VSLLGVPVATGHLSECAAQVVRWAREVTPQAGSRYVCATSVHGLVEGWRDPTFHAVLVAAAANTPDGVPLVWLGRLKGRRQMTRVSGPDLMLEVCRQSALPGSTVRHFFYGGAPGVAEELARRLAARFPGLAVAGCASPPFRDLAPAELAIDAEKINRSGADIVWVGLGTPKQERWAAAMRQRLRTKVLLTVGAAFDFHTGRLRQAPPRVQRAGLEWAYRLAQEPRRLWRRYLTNNPLFVALATAELLGWLKMGDAHDG